MMATRDSVSLSVVVSFLFEAEIRVTSDGDYWQDVSCLDWQELSALLDSGAYDWEDSEPIWVNPLEEGATRPEWLQNQLTEWNMEADGIYHYLRVPVPLEWAEGLVDDGTTVTVWLGDEAIGETEYPTTKEEIDTLVKVSLKAAVHPCNV